MSVFQGEIEQTAEIGDLAIKIRLLGERDALDELTRRSKESSDEGVRRTAKIVRDGISTDFEKYWKRLQGPVPQHPPTVFVGSQTSVPDLVKVIRTGQDANQVAIGFLNLRDSAGVQFPMFDFDAVEKWCKENTAKCQ